MEVGPYPLYPRKRTCAVQLGMSALGQQRISRYLFDRLIGPGKERRWHGKTEGFHSLEIDDKVELGRRLHRKVSRLLALENAIDVACREPVLVVRIRPIGDESAGADKNAVVIDRRQFVPRRQRDD